MTEPLDPSGASAAPPQHSPADEQPAADLVTVQPISLRFRHALHFTRGVFAAGNALLADAVRDAVGRPVRMAAVIDEGVARAWPRLAGDLAAYARLHPDVFPAEVPALVVAGGEACKNGTAALDAVLRHIHDNGLCRKSMLLAIGGGALLDVAGFAAATAHRGIRLARIATTTVSQGDSCVGVKNGINFFGKKNYLGTFSVPDLVVCDEALLASLGERDWRAGFSEAVKVALIRDAGFLDEIRAAAPAIRRRDLAAASPVLRKSAELHLRHIALGGDPFELTSARPLDFGHWAAHKLEQMTGFAVLHGEAVAIGVALDSAISRELGLVTSDELDAILACLEALGFTLWHEAMEDEAALAAGIEEFREHLGGSLTLSMLDGLGGERLVHALPTGALAASLRRLRARRPEPAGASR